jgi:membrane protein YqaA with SNARE-associated domain
MDEVISVKIAAIVCLTAIVISALFKGIDSALIGTVAAIIGGVAGYTIGKAGA